MNFFLDTVGCRLNQAEIERIGQQLRLAGHTIVASPEEADIAVINTCTVTASAASDSRNRIRRIARLGVAEIAITGCWATIEPQAAAAMSNVKWVITNADKETLVADLLGLPHEFLDCVPMSRIPLPGQRMRTRAFIKVQDGCDNHCTYCITALARGTSSSRPIPDVLSDIHAALDGGAKEIVLTGVNLSSWGNDLDVSSDLRVLVRAILELTNVPRLRLSSLEPWDFHAGYLELWRDARLCRHLHLPLQSGSTTVLRRMARKISPTSYAVMLETIRNAIPEMAITTDVIAGFPGETEQEFEETLDFVRLMEFARGHVFTYSPRYDTAAARMLGQVAPNIRKARSAALRQVFSVSESKFRAKFIGQTMPVLWESSRQVSDQVWQLEGLTDNYLRLTTVASQPLWNEFSMVKLTTLSERGLEGEIQVVTATAW